LAVWRGSELQSLQGLCLGSRTKRQSSCREVGRWVLVICKTLSDKLYSISFGLNLPELPPMMLQFPRPPTIPGLSNFLISFPSTPGAKKLCRVCGRVWSGRWNLPPLRGLLQHPEAPVSQIEWEDCEQEAKEPERCGESSVESREDGWASGRRKHKC
jgi:hypothetical protein